MKKLSKKDQDLMQHICECLHIIFQMSPIRKIDFRITVDKNKNESEALMQFHRLNTPNGKTLKSFQISSTRKLQDNK